MESTRTPTIPHYTKANCGAEVVFSVTPGKPPTNLGFIIGGGILCMTCIGIPAGIPLLVMGLTPIGATLALGKRGRLLRPVTLRVSQHSLALPPELTTGAEPAHLQASEIHRLVVRNYLLEDQGYVSTAVGGSGTAAGVMMMGMEYRGKVAKEIGWAVDAEVGGRAYTLAFGLDEITANGLFQDIRRVMGF